MKNVPIAVFKNDEDVDRIIWFYDLSKGQGNMAKFFLTYIFRDYS
jgi:hypothetical protein